jgi:hypothetical protein
MEELERFSLYNNQTKPPENLTEESILESSVHESELEYTHGGNIRASTYKRTPDTQARKRYKSEERKPENFFTKEYLDGRYVNDRVEMELCDFKKEIEKKFNVSGLKDYKFNRVVKSALSFDMGSGQRACS